MVDFKQETRAHYSSAKLIISPQTNFGRHLLMISTLVHILAHYYACQGAITFTFCTKCSIILCTLYFGTSVILSYLVLYLWTTPGYVISLINPFSQFMKKNIYIRKHKTKNKSMMQSLYFLIILTATGQVSWSDWNYSEWLEYIIEWYRLERKRNDKADIVQIILVTILTRCINLRLHSKQIQARPHSPVNNYGLYFL